MDIRSLRYFAAAFEEGSITRAARRCFISQPSVSGAISGLEEELETRLFVRHKKGVVPTPQAKELYPFARKMLDETEALRRRFKQPAVERRLTLGLMQSLDIARTMELLRPFSEDPDLRLRLVGGDDECDARIVSRTLIRKNESFVVLWKERYVVALPAAHPLALREKVRAMDLVSIDLVARCHCENAELFARAGKRLETVAVAQSEEWALALVAAGLGVAFVPEGVAANAVGVVLRPIADADFLREVGLAYGRSPSAEVERLIRVIRPPRRGRRRA
ncbi:MAG: LysR family transcriptional regulator [Myxococcales bacterium]|nr:LysR family transcriptional regulator [Myxococcales bacterium]MCB9581646.1 LysR family transcriptional regulator [Polyangiaceae bacterium]